MKFNRILMGAAFAAIGSVSATASFADTCTGVCGSLGANGVVTLSPSGNASYQYVTTTGGLSGVGAISSVGGTNGSLLVSTQFSANAGDPLTFYFNYVTSDGAGFSDYGWAELQDNAGGHVAWLFTGRTQPSGNTSPGFGLPANDSTLSPATSAIIGGGPIWSPLGGSSGGCWSSGCGYTGWIQSSYDIVLGGIYQVAFGVTNWSDTLYDTGLAFDGLAVAGVPVNPPATGSVPEPATWTMLLLGAGGLVTRMRNRRRTKA